MWQDSVPTGLVAHGHRIQRRHVRVHRPGEWFQRRSVQLSQRETEVTATALNRLFTYCSTGLAWRCVRIDTTDDALDVCSLWRQKQGCLSPRAGATGTCPLSCSIAHFSVRAVSPSPQSPLEFFACGWMSRLSGCCHRHWGLVWYNVPTWRWSHRVCLGLFTPLKA